MSTLAKINLPPTRRIALALAGVAILLAGVLGYFWYRSTLPTPPELDLRGVDPAVVRAIEAARAEVEAAPRSGSAWGRLGMVLLAHQLRKEAAICFAQAEQLDPAEPRWPYFHALAVETDPLLARAKLQRAVERCGATPDMPELRLAEMCLEQGDLDAAERHFNQVREQAPANARARLGLGRVARERGDLEASLAHLGAAAADPHTRKAANALLAEIHHRRNDPAAAQQARARAAELPGDQPWPDPFWEEVRGLVVSKQARLIRLQQLNQQGKHAEAQVLAQQLEREYPEIRLLVTGRERNEQRSYPEAERTLRQAAEIDPASVDIQYELGIALLRQGKYGPAAECFRTITDKLEPTHGPAHLSLGHCWKAQNYRPVALQAYRTAVQLMPQNADAQLALGQLLAEMGQPAEALNPLQNAVRLRPGDRKARELLDQVQKESADARKP